MSYEVQKIFETPDPDGVIRRAIDLLDEGQLIILPTETVYGAAVRLDRPKGVDAFRTLRGDVKGPFTIHVASAAKVRDLVGPLSELGLRMTQKLWPGSLRKRKSTRVC